MNAQWIARGLVPKQHPGRNVFNFLVLLFWAVLLPFHIENIKYSAKALGKFMPICIFLLDGDMSAWWVDAETGTDVSSKKYLNHSVVIGIDRYMEI